MIPAFDSHIFKRAVAFVAVENRAAIAGDEEVDEAVIVKVGGDRRHAVNVRGHAGLVGDIGEGAVAVVPVEMVVRRSRGRLLQRVRMHAVFQRLAADHVEIGQSVVVVVEPDAAGAGAFEQRAELLRAEAVRELNAGLRGGIFEPDRAGRTRWRRLRQQRGGQEKES